MMIQFKLKQVINWLLILICLVLGGCGGESPTPIIIDDDDTQDTEYENSQQNTDEIQKQTVEVPFIEKNGVRIIDVKVNGCYMNMIFDTGAAHTTITLTEASFLYKHGYITDEDIKGFSQAMIADGTIVENRVIVLRSIVIGEIEFTDVEATVILNQDAPLLLGNKDILDKVDFTVNNDKRTITFEF